MTEPPAPAADATAQDATAQDATAKDTVRRTVRYAGRVQGVGFRFTAQETAAVFRVTGYVQNLHDGRVLMVAEGARSEVERFCRALEVTMQRNITGTDVDEQLAEPQCSDFTIRR